MGVPNAGDLALWTGFRDAVRGGAMADPARYRPLRPALLRPLMGFIGRLQAASLDWEQGETELESFRVGERVHFIASLADGSGEATPPFCFTLLLEDGRWYLEHMESIFIRLDRMEAPPVSEFPDLEEEQKAWIRDEIHVSEQVRLFTFLSREKGPEFAYDWFRDGAGYALQARTWVPFVTPHRAFVLYACWDLARLRLEPTVLEYLSDEAARIRYVPRVFALYRQTAHLEQQIAFEDYRRLFEIIWRDRARHGGWQLDIVYHREECVLHLASVEPSANGRRETAFG